MKLEKTQRISFVAFLVAIQTLLLWLEESVILLSPFLIVILPFFSALVILYGPKHSFVLYLFSSMFFCFLFRPFGGENALFTLLPSLFIGALQGLGRKKHLSEGFLLCSCAFLHFLFSLLLLPLFQLLYGVTLLETYQVLFSLPTEHTWRYFLPILFLLSSLQTFFTNVAISYLLKESSPKTSMKYASYLGCFFSLFAGLSYWFFPLVSHLFLIITILFCFLGFESIWKKKSSYVVAIFFAIIDAILYILLQNRTPWVSPGVYMLPFYLLLSLYEILQNPLEKIFKKKNFRYNK